jgi:hypothetical protein
MIVTLSTTSLSTRAAHMPAKLPPITRALVVGMASPFQEEGRRHKPGFAIWTDCRPPDGVHGAARPVGQLVSTSQYVKGSHFGNR